MNQCRLLS